MIFTYYRDADGDADTNIGTFSTALERRDDSGSTHLQALRNAPVTTIHGIGTARAEQLETAGYDSVDDVATAAPTAIETTTGISSSTATSIVDSARSIVERWPTDSTNSTDSDTDA